MNFKIAVDCLVFAFDPMPGELKILLVRRNNEPAKGRWALPGGFVTKAEEFEKTAGRKLFEETGVKDIYLDQLKAYGLTGVSPGASVVSVAFYALIRYRDFSPPAQSTHHSNWVHVKKIPGLPFDHARKVKEALEKIRELASVRPIVFALLPDKFPLNQLQKFYEELYETEIDNRNFRRKFKKLPFIKVLKESESNVSHRPGALYSLNRKKMKSYFDNRLPMQ